MITHGPGIGNVMSTNPNVYQHNNEIFSMFTQSTIILDLGFKFFFCYLKNFPQKNDRMLMFSDTVRLGQ